MGKSVDPSRGGEDKHTKKGGGFIRGYCMQRGPSGGLELAKRSYEESVKHGDEVMGCCAWRCALGSWS